MSNPFGGSVPPAVAARMLQDPTRLAAFMQRQIPGWGHTPAAMFSDLVNVQRADVQQMADAIGVEVEVELMSEDRAADLLAGIVDGRGIEIIEVFNEIARKRDLVLRELLDADAYQEFMAGKTSVMHTSDPETWDDSEA